MKIINSATLFIAFLLISISSPFHAIAQFQVSINQSGTGSNSCTRTLTASVQNGSGNYSYHWDTDTPGVPFPGPNNLQTVHVALYQTVDIIVTVTDITSGKTAQDVVTVQRVLLGNFDIFIPNYITPNGDGYNDTWIVTDAAKGYTPINAFGYVVTIVNSSNNQVFHSTGTVSSNHLGLLGGDIVWNARYNGIGSIVPAGIYGYSLILENCSGSQTYSGQLTVVL